MVPVVTEMKRTVNRIPVSPPSSLLSFRVTRTSRFFTGLSKKKFLLVSCPCGRTRLLQWGHI